MLVGMTGFEPAAPRPPGVCATGLRHIPKIVCVVIKLRLMRVGVLGQP